MGMVQGEGRTVAIRILIFLTILCWALPGRATTPWLRERLGAMCMFGFTGTETAAPDVARLTSLIAAERVGGVLLLGQNLRSREQVARLVATLRFQEGVWPLLVAIDQEGGAVQRLQAEHGFSAVPSARRIARNMSPKDAMVTYEAMAGDLAAVGVNLNLGPVVDVDVNSASPAIGLLGRSFSPDPRLVARYAGAFIAAHRQRGIATVLKHFPGHGSANGDSHLQLVDVSTTWSRSELWPYERLLQSNAVDAVMVGHIRHQRLDSQLPASLSGRQIDGVLRGILGFYGVVITDDLLMGAITSERTPEEAAVQALAAGADMLLFSQLDWNGHSLPDSVTKAVARALAEGRLKRSRLDEAYARVIELRRWLKKISGDKGRRASLP